jgi:hypothetical protein
MNEHKTKELDQHEILVVDDTSASHSKSTFLANMSHKLVDLMGGRLTVQSPSNCRLSMDDFRLKDNSKIQYPDNHQSSINRRSGQHVYG